MVPQAMSKIGFIVIMVAYVLSPVAHGLTVGANNNVSLNPTAAFPNGQVNTILGFAYLANGFTLAANTTTCTYNAFFPVSSAINLNGGVLSLLEDLKLAQPIRFTGSGTILANTHTLEFGPTATEFVMSFSFNFDAANLLFDTDARIYGVLQFTDNCKISGPGRKLTLSEGSSLIVRPNSQLILEDITINNVGRTNIRCLMDSGSLVLRNVVFGCSANYTFSRGSILFDKDVVFTGTTTFAYTTGVGSTINSLSTLMFDHDTTFSYAPRRANSNLLFMTDQTSNLYLSGCTLFSTNTGLQLQTGTLLLDDQVTMTSTGRNSGEALLLNSSLITKVKGGATVYMYGQVKYQ